MQLSTVERMIKAGWPVIVLDEQLQMVAGRFNLATSVICMTENIRDGPWSALSRHPFAVHFEGWSNRFNKVAPSPAGKVYQVMIDLRGTECDIEEGTLSRSNLVSAETVVQSA